MSLIAEPVLTVKTDVATTMAEIDALPELLMDPHSICGTTYAMSRRLPDGRRIGIHRLLFHWTLHVDIHEIGYEENFCYIDAKIAAVAMVIWDGTGDPVGWHRHPKSGRRRDLLTGDEWIEF